MPKAASSDAVRFMTVLLLECCFEMRNGSVYPLMRKRPEPQLLLKDLPQAREPVRLDDEEEDDQAAEDDRFGVRHHRVRHLDAERGLERFRDQVEEDRKERDERGAEERAGDRADAADDDHEEHAERQVQGEGLGLDRAE